MSVLSAIGSPASDGASPFLALNEGVNRKVLPCVFGG